MSHYYNEIDPFKAAVLREAIADGAIPAGEVDERSIKDVAADDLRGFTQCHFFAGGGFWAVALRLAGWPDDGPVWTGSCPCPSFSCAGKGGGFDDPRHLWPDWARLIRERRPPVVFGEQADDAVGFGWLDLVQTDLEAQAYAVGKVVLGAHSLGAPHIRQRLYFCADTEHAERRSQREEHPNAHRRNGFGGGCNAERDGWRSDEPGRKAEGRAADGRHRSACNSADADGGFAGDRDLQRSGQHGLFAPDRGAGQRGNAEQGRRGSRRRDESGSGQHSPQRSAGGNDPHASGEVALFHSDSEGDGRLQGRSESAGQQGRSDNAEHCGALDGEHAFQSRLEGHFGDVREWRGPGWLDPVAARSAAAAGATRGFWADCDWWHGRDGKYRPIGPGLFPLAHGRPARVGRLRLYGDAICILVAQSFIETYLETCGMGAR